MFPKNRLKGTDHRLVMQSLRCASRCLVAGMPISGADLRSFWPSLSGFNKAFLILFCGVCVYTLGFCISVQIPASFRVPGDFSSYPLGVVLSELTFLFICDAVIFLGFLVLHSLQWILSTRVDTFAIQMENHC